MNKLIPLMAIAMLSQGCAVSDRMIDNHSLYCSDVYRGLRATARVASSVIVGASTPDLCLAVEEAAEEARGPAEATSKSDGEVSNN